MYRVDNETLERLATLAERASQAEWQISHTGTETYAAALNFMDANIAKGISPDLWMVIFGGERYMDGDQEYVDDARIVAVTGNGPTSEANAEYLSALCPSLMSAILHDLLEERASYLALVAELDGR